MTCEIARGRRDLSCYMVNANVVILQPGYAFIPPPLQSMAQCLAHNRCFVNTDELVAGFIHAFASIFCSPFRLGTTFCLAGVPTVDGEGMVIYVQPTSLCPRQVERKYTLHGVRLQSQSKVKSWHGAIFSFKNLLNYFKSTVSHTRFCVCNIVQFYEFGDVYHLVKQPL